MALEIFIVQCILQLEWAHVLDKEHLILKKALLLIIS